MAKVTEAVTLFIFVLAVTEVAATAGHEPDPKGYVTFCPCMGRFGNQADHYLGAIAFAKGLDRTLILPPWVEYKQGEPRSAQVPFATYFNVSVLAEYHRVIPMEEFMETLAGEVWPQEERVSFCYGHRKGPEPESCNAKDGNPFGPFWDTFGIDFDRSVAYGPLHYDVHNTEVAADWSRRYPPSEYPVLAFTGAPASYPVQAENVKLSKYLVYNDEMVGRGDAFIRENLARGPFIGVHLRNGPDWERACEHVANSPTLFASAQCVGYRGERGHVTSAMCLPSEEIIVKQLRKAISKHGAKAVFVASDHDHMTKTLAHKYFKRSDVAFVKAGTWEDAGGPHPHLDLYVLSRANFFIGNCVSSFSSFVKRQRDDLGMPSGFWAFPPDFRDDSRTHDPGEL